MQIELELIKMQMLQDEERQKKAMAELKKQYESKVQNDQQIETIRQKTKDIKKDVDEANEIAKFMNKDI